MIRAARASTTWARVWPLATVWLNSVTASSPSTVVVRVTVHVSPARGEPLKTRVAAAAEAASTVAEVPACTSWAMVSVPPSPSMARTTPVRPTENESSPAPPLTLRVPESENWKYPKVLFRLKTPSLPVASSRPMRMPVCPAVEASMATRALTGMVEDESARTADTSRPAPASLETVRVLPWALARYPAAASCAASPATTSAMLCRPVTVWEYSTPLTSRPHSCPADNSPVKDTEAVWSAT